MSGPPLPPPLPPPSSLPPPLPPPPPMPLMPPLPDDPPYRHAYHSPRPPPPPPHPHQPHTSTHTPHLPRLMDLPFDRIVSSAQPHQPHYSHHPHHPQPIDEPPRPHYSPHPPQPNESPRPPQPPHSHQPPHLHQPHHTPPPQSYVPVRTDQSDRRMWPGDPTLHHHGNRPPDNQYYGNVYERHAQVRHTRDDLPRPQDNDGPSHQFQQPPRPPLPPAPLPDVPTSSRGHDYSSEHFRRPPSPPRFPPYPPINRSEPHESRNSTFPLGPPAHPPPNDSPRPLFPSIRDINDHAPNQIQNSGGYSRMPPENFPQRGRPRDHQVSPDPPPPPPPSRPLFPSGASCSPTREERPPSFGQDREHRDFSSHSLNEGVREEFPHGSPRQEQFERRNQGGPPPGPRSFDDRGIPPHGLPNHNDYDIRGIPPHGPPNHHSFDDRGIPPPNEFRRPPLLPLPHPQHDFNDRVSPQVMRPVGEVAMPPLRMPKIKTVPAEKIFDPPGRNERPSHIVVILRGLPGAGKSHVARIIKEKETSLGGAAPRILSIDAYFMNEVEKSVKDPDTGRRVKKKIEEYEYDEAMEPSYRSSLYKMFNKTLNDGFFPLIIVDATNHKVCHFDRFWSNAKTKGFEVFIVELVESVEVCLERNIHNRTKEEIQKLSRQWEQTPPHFTRLDVTSLLSDSNIDEVEMECANSDDEAKDDEMNQQDQQESVAKSRWDDPSEDKLDKLDAVGSFRRRKRRLPSEAEEELSLTEYLRRKQEEEENAGPKRKRVRWADLEAVKEEQRKKEVGFCIGGGWSQLSSEEAETILRGKTNNTVATEQVSSDHNQTPRQPL